MNANTDYLVLPNDTRRITWYWFGDEIPISVGDYMARWLANMYRRKLKELYPNASGTQLVPMVRDFERMLGVTGSPKRTDDANTKS